MFSPLHSKFWTLMDFSHSSTKVLGIFAMSQQSVYILQLTAAVPTSIHQMKKQHVPLLLHTEEAGLPGKLVCSIIPHLYHILLKNIFGGGHTSKLESSSGLGFQPYWMFWQFRIYAAASQNSQGFEDQDLDWGKKLVWVYGFPVDNQCGNIAWTTKKNAHKGKLYPGLRKQNHGWLSFTRLGSDFIWHL